MLKTYLAVMFGGALGTGLRLWLSGFLTAKYGESFPLGTLVVNVVGCFIMGAVATVTKPGGLLPASVLTHQVIAVGVLGGFTTFSSFGLQTFNLFTRGDWWGAGWNVILSLVLCLVAVWLGHLVAVAFQPAARP